MNRWKIYEILSILIWLSLEWPVSSMRSHICEPLRCKGEGEVAQSCPTLCDPMDCNLLGFSVHGILQARTLEWIAISFSKGSSRPRDRTRVSCIGGRRFNFWATRVQKSHKMHIVLKREVSLAHLPPTCQKGKMLSSSWLRNFWGHMLYSPYPTTSE